jgi:TetR/AcrR family transcriptional regulator, cholesterol catabolism regulator
VASPEQSEQTEPTEQSEQASARRSRRTEVRRAQIVDAAAELFAEVGYAPATLEAVGERVGLSKASLYHYVRNKEDLLAQIMLDALDDVAGRFAAAAGGLAGDPAAKLHALARTDGRYRGLITSLVAEGVAAGRFRPVDDEVFGWTFMLALNDIAAWWTPAHPRTPEDIADEIAGYFLDGLRA